MKLPSHQITAFIKVAEEKSFSKAAAALSVTQSALSQRISTLEAEIETTLIIREPSGLSLTHAGELLLRYCQTAQSLEEEVLKQLKSTSQKLAGTFRIAGFSSVMRSVIIPSLSPFLRKNPDVVCEFKSFEVNELLNVLKSSRADIIILDHQYKKNGIVQHVLGKEEYVVIESSNFQTPKDLYLDHGPQDNATEDFFRSQATNYKNYRRSFMGDVYGVISGVEEGLGRAVMSKHLLKNNKKIKVLKGFKKYNRDITLHYYEQSYYSKLHQEFVRELEANAKGFL
jgi:DNA-binding transcriptional LysR family regulator